jgi:hypothetical protein
MNFNIPETPTWLSFIIGDWLGWHRRTQHMIINSIADIGSISLAMFLFPGPASTRQHTLFPTKYAMVVIAYACGVFYAMLPVHITHYDLIADKHANVGMSKHLYVPILGLMIVGLCLWWKATLTFPMEPLFEKFLVALLAVQVAGYFNVKFRYFCVGVWGVLGQFVLWMKLTKHVGIATGVGLYFFGFLYNALRVSVAPQCPGCLSSMQWSSYASGTHAAGWICDIYACGTLSKHAGEYRWFCRNCRKDICRSCYPRL